MKKEPQNRTPEPWTQHELELLHQMVRDYDRAKWFKGQLKWWGIWILGLPSAALMVWEPLARLWKLLKSGW
jgi:hypothetical protein